MAVSPLENRVTICCSLMQRNNRSQTRQFRTVREAPILSFLEWYVSTLFGEQMDAAEGR